MHLYSTVSISTWNLKWSALPITEIWVGQNLEKKTGHVTPSMPLLVVLCRHRLGFDVVYLRAQFDESSFSLSRDIIGVSKLKVGQVTLTTSLSGIVCLPWASTCYDRPIYQIWSLSLPSTKIRIAIKDSENVGVWGSYGSLKVTGNSTIPWSVCCVVTMSLSCTICERDIGWKLPIWTYPTCLGTLVPP